MPPRKGFDDSPHEITRRERRRRALDLRKKGWTYEAIGDDLGITKKNARELVVTTIRSRLKREKETAEAITKLELDRLDMALKGLAKKVEAGDTRACEVWIRVSESRRKLLGLDAPEKKQVAVGLVQFEECSDPELVSWAQRFGLSVGIQPLDEKALPYLLPGEVAEALVEADVLDATFEPKPESL